MRLSPICLAAFLLAPVPRFLAAQQANPGPVLSGSLAPSTTLHPPMGEKLKLKARGEGVQIYTCTEGSGSYTWTLKSPDAKLVDAAGHAIGSHSAGPTWTLQDGSSIQGKTVASKKSAYSDAVPWLLLAVQSHNGQGKLSTIEYVQRTDTHGGVAPSSGCDATHANQETRVSYTATYSFYGRD